MPYLQLDVPAHYPVAVKRDLAQLMGEIYADVMETTANLVDVCFRELGEGGLWHCDDSGPVPSTVLVMHIRRGRPPEQRARLASAMIDACAEALGLDPTRLTVEFIQHAGDEIFRKVLVDGVLRGSLGRDWSPTEPAVPMMAGMIAEARAAT